MSNMRKLMDLVNSSKVKTSKTKMINESGCGANEKVCGCMSYDCEKCFPMTHDEHDDVNAKNNDFVNDEGQLSPMSIASTISEDENELPKPPSKIYVDQDSSNDNGLEEKLWDAFEEAGEAGLAQALGINEMELDGYLNEVGMELSLHSDDDREQIIDQFTSNIDQYNFNTVAEEEDFASDEGVVDLGDSDDELEDTSKFDKDLGDANMGSGSEDVSDLIAQIEYIQGAGMSMSDVMFPTDKLSTMDPERVKRIYSRVMGESLDEDMEDDITDADAGDSSSEFDSQDRVVDLGDSDDELEDTSKFDKDLGDANMGSGSEDVSDLIAQIEFAQEAGMSMSNSSFPIDKLYSMSPERVKRIHSIVMGESAAGNFNEGDSSDEGKPLNEEDYDTIRDLKAQGYSRREIQQWMDEVKQEKQQRKEQERTGLFQVFVDGKPLKIRGELLQVRGKDATIKTMRTLASKPFNKGKAFTANIASNTNESGTGTPFTLGADEAPIYSDLNPRIEGSEVVIDVDGEAHYLSDDSIIGLSMDDTSNVIAFPEDAEAFHDRFDASSELDSTQLEELISLAKKVHPMRFKSVDEDANQVDSDSESQKLIDIYFPNKSDLDGQSGKEGRYGSYKLGLLAKELEDLGYEKEQISDTKSVYRKEGTHCPVYMDTAFGADGIPYAWCEESDAEPETSEVIDPDGDPIEIPRTNEGAYGYTTQQDYVDLEFNPDTNMIYGSMPVFGSDQNGGEEEVLADIEYNIATQEVKFLPSIESLIQDGVEDGVYFDVDEMTADVKHTIKIWAQSNDVKVYEDSCDSVEEDSGSYTVVMKGGSIGDNTSKGKQFSSKEEAKAYAKRLNAQLSPGEKKHYSMKYIVQSGSASLDEETDNLVRDEEQQEAQRLIDQVGNNENGIEIVAKRMGKSADDIRKLLDDNLSEQKEESYVDYVQRMLKR